MQNEILEYIDVCNKNTKRAISSFLRGDKTKQIAQETFLFYFGEKSQPFQEYYVENIGNRESFLSASNYFRIFKQRYSLQGIDGNFLDKLEKEKIKILNYIDDESLADLYFEFFAFAQLQHGEKTVSKNLGSFFAKLVHTFCPDKYCALDNPIKNYFGLERESFYLAFIIVSNAYQEWVKENPILMQDIRNELERNLSAKSYSGKMTNLKLLDMIFWYQTNVVIKNGQSHFQ